MRVTVAEGAGFCKGVKRAVDMALDLARKYGRLYTLGELVHNEEVTAFLASKGVVCLKPEKWDSLKASDVALIRAHGIQLEVESRLRDRGVVLFDATCPVVKRNQLLAKERAEKGDDIVIIGDAAHDEVVGLISYAAGRAKVFGSAEMPEIGENNASILFQTTVLRQNFKKIQDFVKNFQKNHHNLVEIFNTICYTTEAKQDEARSLAAKTQAVVVLGSHTSANTRRLFEVASEVNANTYFVTDVAEAREAISKIKEFKSVSIVAGASTPPWLIREVTKLMSETQTTETEVTKEATLHDQPETEAPATEAPVLEETATETPEAEKAPEAEKPAKESNSEPTTMEELMSSTSNGGYTEYRPGKRVKGVIITANADGIIVNIGGKNDGFIDKSEATLDGNYDPADYKSGDEVQVVILSSKNGQVQCSKKQVDKILKEDEEAEIALSSGEFTLKLTEVVKGGLRGRLGKYTIFVPASQIRMGYVSNLEEYKDKTMRLVLMPPKEKASDGEEGEAPAEEKPHKRSRYLFASHRLILEREKKEKEDTFWNSIHVNDIITGKVKRFTPFGAFVSVKGFDCLAHISELSWNKITDPSTVLTIGESYDFVVLKLDRETGRISLGYKQLQPKPYEVAKEKYPVGTVIKGKVERIFSYGAFISIDEGVDGLVHVSQISHSWVKDANEVLKVGQEVEAKIISFDDNRITLSIKEVLPAPEQSEQPAEEHEATEEEKAARRSERAKKFEKRSEGGEGKKERKPKKETSNEPKEWVSGSGSASLGDLIQGLDIKFDDDENK